MRRYIPQIVNAFHRQEARNALPRSINGLWKADLFVGSAESDKWVGTTVKVQPNALAGARGLRVGIYPKANAKDVPRKDDSLNLIRLPLPYDADFMEIYYKSFYLVRAFLKADARVPAPVALPDAEDRFLTSELEKRREFSLLDVIAAIRDMSQQTLLETESVASVSPTATCPRRKAWRTPGRGRVTGRLTRPDGGVLDASTTWAPSRSALSTSARTGGSIRSLHIDARSSRVFAASNPGAGAKPDSFARPSSSKPPWSLLNADSVSRTLFGSAPTAVFASTSGRSEPRRAGDAGAPRRPDRHAHYSRKLYQTVSGK